MLASFRKVQGTSLHHVGLPGFLSTGCPGDGTPFSTQDFQPSVQMASEPRLGGHTAWVPSPGKSNAKNNFRDHVT